MERAGAELPRERDASDPGLPSASERVGWLLFAAKRPPEAGNTTWLSFSDEELGAAVAARTPVGSAAFWRGMVAGVRDGSQPVPIPRDALESVAAALGAPREILGERPDLALAARSRIAWALLEQAGVRRYWACRTESSRTDWRVVDDPERALPFLRWGEMTSPRRPEARRSRAVGVVSDSCDDHSGRGACWDDSGEWHAGLRRGGRFVAEKPLTEEQLRTLCRQFVTDLGLRPPLDPRDLCRVWSQRRGRRVSVTGAELGATTSIGHLVVLEDRDRIFYEKSAPSPQQAHVIYHEVVHLLRGHLDGAEQLSCGVDLEEAPADGPRGLYARWQEWEAEVGATVLSALSQERSRPGHLAADDSEDARALAGAFGLSEGGLL